MPYTFNDIPAINAAKARRKRIARRIIGLGILAVGVTFALIATFPLWGGVGEALTIPGLGGSIPLGAGLALSAPAAIVVVSLVVAIVALILVVGLALRKFGVISPTSDRPPQLAALGSGSGSDADLAVDRQIAGGSPLASRIPSPPAAPLVTEVDPIAERAAAHLVDPAAHHRAFKAALEARIHARRSAFIDPASDSEGAFIGSGSDSDGAAPAPSVTGLPGGEAGANTTTPATVVTDGAHADPIGNPAANHDVRADHAAFATDIAHAVRNREAHRIENERALFTACENENLPEVERLLSRGVNVNVVDKDGDTPLHYAVGNKQSVELMSKLLKAGASLDVADNEGRTPRQIAVRMNYAKEVAQAVAAVSPPVLQQMAASRPASPPTPDSSSASLTDSRSTPSPTLSLAAPGRVGVFGPAQPKQKKGAKRVVDLDDSSVPLDNIVTRPGHNHGRAGRGLNS